MLTVTKYNSENLSINININNKFEYIPKSESIKKYIDYETEKVLKQTLIDDRDVENISFIPKNPFSIIPYFNNLTDYGSIGITNLVFVREAFYVFDIYDSFSDTNQRLLSRNFLKLLTVFSSFTSTNILFDNKKLGKGYRNIYIPSYYLDTLTSNTVYLKISFFNPANGKLRFFECNSAAIDGSKNYFKITIDKDKKTYFITDSPLYNIYQVIQQKTEDAQVNDKGINKLGVPTLKIKTISNKGKAI